ncbi:phosphoribosylaminoimidazolesuccinocarboxamide synthase [Orientia tsutsugamushi]|nr:phosphoribosylaminoimidazolesuccinocarboxamide synthase [Orientia tsutsugamushi]
MKIGQSKYTVRLSKEKIFEGNSKIIYRIDEYTLIQFFKDDMRINAEKVIQVSDKGVLNNRLLSKLVKEFKIINARDQIKSKSESFTSISIFVSNNFELFNQFRKKSNVISNYIFKRVSMVGINHHLI